MTNNNLLHTAQNTID